jgi:hypothetical protein
MVGVVVVNTGMLGTALGYLVTLPFRDGLAVGLAVLLLPPFTVYYWVKHWRTMRMPVLNTLRSFAPIVLVGLAYVFFEEAPVIEREAERVERALGGQENATGRLGTPGLRTSGHDAAPGAKGQDTGVIP